MKMQSMISHRLTCAYFVIGSLSLLKVFESEEETKKLGFTIQDIISWVYRQINGDCSLDSPSDSYSEENGTKHYYLNFYRPIRNASTSG